MIYYCRYCSKRFKHGKIKCIRCLKYCWIYKHDYDKQHVVPLRELCDEGSAAGWLNAALQNEEILQGVRQPLQKDSIHRRKVAMLRQRFFTRIALAK